MSEVSTKPACRCGSWPVPALLIASTAAMAAWLLWRVHLHAVNVLYWDQWDFWTPMFEGKGLAAIFWHPHGVRLGLGNVLSALLGQLTGWNMRAEGFMIAAMLIAAAVAALVLRRAVLERWEWYDVIWPGVFLSPLMLGAIVVVSIPSHGILPLLLLMLFCLALGLRRPAVRYPALLVINFLTTFAGFGLFLGMVAPGLFLLDAIAYWRRGAGGGGRGGRQWRSVGAALAAVAICVGTLGLYMYGFKVDPSLPDYHFPDPKPWRYIQFIVLQLAYLGGFRGDTTVAYSFGAGFLVLVLVIGALHVWQLMAPRAAGDDRNVFVSRVVVTLLGFGLLFSAFCAAGRLPLGILGGQATRYMPLLVGMMLGLYLHFAALRPGIFRTAVLLWMVASLLYGHTRPRPYDDVVVDAYTTGKTVWKQTYLATGSVNEADRQATRAAPALYFPGGFKIYSFPEATRLEWKLSELRRRRLNLFLDAPATRPASEP